MSNSACDGLDCPFEHVRGRGDAEIARIAEAQHGVVHRRQLVAAGLGRGAITHRMRVRRMHPTSYCDVYLWGWPTREPLALATAAILHFHPHAVLSHRTASALWGLHEPQEGEPVELTLIGRSTRVRPGVRHHRVRHLDRDDIRTLRRLPVTAPGRTLVDLAGCLRTLELENALAECRRRHLARDRQIRAAIARAPRRTGVAGLRALLDGGTPARTRSQAERILLGMLRDADLPSPIANASVCGHQVDLLWPDRRLIVEFDGWDTHHTRTAFERDRRRDQRLTAAGFRVIRITWRQLRDEPYAVIARISAALHTHLERAS